MTDLEKIRSPTLQSRAENVLRSDTRGTSEAVNARYELMGRGGYIPSGYKFDLVVLDARLPLELLEGRNALRIAQSTGKAANDSSQHAVKLVDIADSFTEKRGSKEELIATSRDTVQTAEDARTIAVKNLDRRDETDQF